MSLAPHIASDSVRSSTNRITERDAEERRAEALPTILIGERLLTAQAMRLLMRLDRDLREDRSQFNQDWFRRLMRVRSKAASRLRRRWEEIYPTPTVPLGNLRTRYHANLSKYLYQPSENWELMRQSLLSNRNTA